MNPLQFKAHSKTKDFCLKEVLVRLGKKLKIVKKDHMQFLDLILYKIKKVLKHIMLGKT